MTPEQEFDRQLAAIHGLRDPCVHPSKSVEATMMDVQHAEIDAMVDVFLGKDYDPMKRRGVKELQTALRRQQAELVQRFNSGEISRDQYVDAANAAMEQSFQKCAQMLGPMDYEKLFGESVQVSNGLIDRAAFLGTSSSFVSTSYSNFCRLSSTPEELLLDFGLNTQLIPTVNEPIKLTQRVVMNFYTAKRLLLALMRAISDHENRYGILELDVQRRARVGAPQIAALQER